MGEALRYARAMDPFSDDALDARITLHEAAEVLEIDLTGLVFKDSAQANAYFDRIETRIAEAGEPLWFFLVIGTDYRVWDEAWFAYTRRGKECHAAHSMGTLHVDASDMTAKQIARTRGTDLYDPNLFASRDAAWEDIKTRPSKRRERIAHVPNYRRFSFTKRFVFRPKEDRLDIDFSHVNMEHSRDVHDIYNWLEHAIRATERKWWFLMDYSHFRIQSGAWVAYDQRKTACEAALSLGTVRYAPGAETETDIRLRMEARGTRPNIRNTRDAALERLAELRAETSG
ncbi:MAG: hypothetical protein AAFR53_05460 [Pseudomonadota bacterium]